MFLMSAGVGFLFGDCVSWGVLTVGLSVLAVDLAVLGVMLGLGVRLLRNIANNTFFKKTNFVFFKKNQASLPGFF